MVKPARPQRLPVLVGLRSLRLSGMLTGSTEPMDLSREVAIECHRLYSMNALPLVDKEARDRIQQSFRFIRTNRMTTIFKNSQIGIGNRAGNFF